MRSLQRCCPLLPLPPARFRRNASRESIQLWRCGANGARLTQAHQAPVEILPLPEVEKGDGWGRAAIGARHTSGVEKADVTDCFIARNVSVTVQKNIAIF